MKMHVHCFGATWLDVVSENPKCCTVVGFDLCLGLFVAHLCEELAHWNCFTGIDVECAKFALAALDMTAFNILDVLSTAPLLLGLSESWVQKKWPPTLLWLLLC